MANPELAKKNPSNLSINIILILLVAVITVAPLILVKDAEFAGADGLAEEAIVEMNKEYEPWFAPLFEPASGEIESLLFALQAAIGAGVIGYGIGYLRGKQKR